MQRFCIIFKFSIMPRKPRESSGTGIYHVMLRGINRQDIFDDTEDYWTFIKMMSAVPCYIYAYCLMPNILVMEAPGYGCLFSWQFFFYIPDGLVIHASNS